MDEYNRRYAQPNVQFGGTHQDGSGIVHPRNLKNDIIFETAIPVASSVAGTALGARAGMLGALGGGIVGGLAGDYYGSKHNAKLMGMDNDEAEDYATKKAATGAAIGALTAGAGKLPIVRETAKKVVPQGFYKWLTAQDAAVIKKADANHAKNVKEGFNKTIKEYPLVSVGITEKPAYLPKQPNPEWLSELPDVFDNKVLKKVIPGKNIRKGIQGFVREGKPLLSEAEKLKSNELANDIFDKYVNDHYDELYNAVNETYKRTSKPSGTTNYMKKLQFNRIVQDIKDGKAINIGKYTGLKEAIESLERVKLSAARNAENLVQNKATNLTQGLATAGTLGLASGEDGRVSVGFGDDYKMALPDISAMGGVAGTAKEVYEKSKRIDRTFEEGRNDIVGRIEDERGVKLNDSEVDQVKRALDFKDKYLDGVAQAGSRAVVGKVLGSATRPMASSLKAVGVSPKFAQTLGYRQNRGKDVAAIAAQIAAARGLKVVLDKTVSNVSNEQGELDRMLAHNSGDIPKTALSTVGIETTPYVSMEDKVDEIKNTAVNRARHFHNDNVKMAVEATKKHVENLRKMDRSEEEIKQTILRALDYIDKQNNSFESVRNDAWDELRNLMKD